MKKILFSLGTVAAIIAPVVVAVSCGSKSSPKLSPEEASKKINALLAATDSNWTATKADHKAWLEIGADGKSLKLNDSDGSKSIFNVNTKSNDYAKYLPLATTQYLVGNAPSADYQQKVDGLRWLTDTSTNGKHEFIAPKVEEAFNFICEYFGLDKTLAKDSLTWKGYVAETIVDKEKATNQ